MSTKVSVCVPSYNAGRFLPAAIESVLSQTFTDFELIVSDDASDDDTVEVCTRYVDARLKIARSEERLGQSGNWNRCLELATAPYVILLHADDELCPGYLERAVAMLDSNPDVGLVHCAVEHIDEAGKSLSLQRLFERDTIDRDGVTLRRLVLDGCVISPAGVMVRRSVYAQAGPFTDMIVWGVDWHMWIRISLEWPVGYVSDTLARYREHDQSGTTAVMASGRNARDETWAIEDLFARICLARPEFYELKPLAIRGVAHRTWCAAERMCELGDMAAARAGLRNAVRMWPGMIFQPKVWALWAASYTNYRWFAAAHSRKDRVMRKLRREAAAAP
jgi:glycosyltransferase involved in cell wall biosynthesis